MNTPDREWTQKQMNRIFNYLVKIGSSREDAKDIVQETFYKSLLYSDSIPSDKLSSWLFKVAINTYYDLCRRQKKWIPMPPQFDIVSDKYLLEELVVMETQQEVHATLQEMSPTYKELLEMRYAKEMSYQDIGNSLDMKTDKVKTYLARAKKQFQKLYTRSIKDE